MNIVLRYFLDNGVCKLLINPNHSLIKSLYKKEILMYKKLKIDFNIILSSKELKDRINFKYNSIYNVIKRHPELIEYFLE
jgi:hypothetical protein